MLYRLHVRARTFFTRSRPATYMSYLLRSILKAGELY